MRRWLPVGRQYPSLEALSLMRPAALTVHALGWYGSLGGAVDMYVADRVVVPPEFATGVCCDRKK